MIHRKDRDLFAKIDAVLYGHEQQHSDEGAMSVWEGPPQFVGEASGEPFPNSLAVPVEFTGFNMVFSNVQELADAVDRIVIHSGNGTLILEDCTFVPANTLQVGDTIEFTGAGIWAEEFTGPRVIRPAET